MYKRIVGMEDLVEEEATSEDAQAAGKLGIRVIGVKCGVGNGGICWRRGVWRFIGIRRICCCVLRGRCWGGEVGL